MQNSKGIILLENFKKEILIKILENNNEANDFLNQLLFQEISSFESKTNYDLQLNLSISEINSLKDCLNENKNFINGYIFSYPTLSKSNLYKLYLKYVQTTLIENKENIFFMGYVALINEKNNVKKRKLRLNIDVH